MTNNASTIGAIALVVAMVLIWHFATNRTDCTAAHYGGRATISVGELHRRLNAERPSNQYTPQTNSWLSAWSHDAPEAPLTTAQAHDAMRLHRECRMDSCERKRAAYWALVADGRIRPDRRAERRAAR
ncbi:hypothetical protein [Nocardia concava]|uniref:hypothetical protein n=1 Tax=Nocardia concava TaxID=257281 RepID=UPI00059288BB|nr:hypothetical protein [Nocardia concava]